MDNPTDFLAMKKLSLKELLARDVELALCEFKDQLKPDSARFDSVILLLERYHRNKKGFLTKIISFEDSCLEFSSISNFALLQINSLNINDLKQH